MNSDDFYLIKKTTYTPYRLAKTRRINQEVL